MLKDTVKKYLGFTGDERSAMKDRAEELKADGNSEKNVLARIAKMRDADRVIAEKLHTIIKENAPGLTPKLWYGMPAYATTGRDSRIVCFYQPARKFKSRYGTLGFNDIAALDEGNVWPTYFAIATLTAGDEKKIAGLVRQAVS